MTAVPSMLTRPALPLYLAAAVLLTGLLLFPAWTVDDAFISYRYGQNLVEHGQLVWNPGQPPVEGYTGILLPLLAAAFLGLGLSPVIGIKVLSWMAAVGMAFLLRRWLLRSGGSAWIANLSVLLWAFNPLIYTHSYSGLETMLFACGVLALFLTVSDAAFSRQASPWGLAVLAWSVSMIRPEGALAGTLALAAAGRLRGWKYVVGPFLLFLLPWLAVQLWRYEYYGYWLPNSWAAKQWSGGLVNPESLWKLARFCCWHMLLPAFACGMLLVRRESRPSDRGFYILLTVTALFVLVSSAVYLRSALFMDYGHRFFFPFWGPVMALALYYLSQAGVTRAWVAVLAVLQLGTGLREWVREVHFTRYYDRIMEEAWKPAAALLRERLPAGSRIVCYMDAGAIPYFSGMEAWDFGLLNDVFLARTRPDSAEVQNYFFQIHPDAVVFTSETADSLRYLPGAHGITHDPRFHAWHLVRIFGNSSGFPYYQFVYLRENVGDLTE